MYRRSGLSYTTVGVIALVVGVVAIYFGFTKSNPFANPFEVRAAFRSTNNIRTNSPVRIAGVTVGKVTKVERNGDRGAVVTLQIEH